MMVTLKNTIKTTVVLGLCAMISAFAQDATINKAPKGDLPGWKQVFREDFTRDAALGAFPGQDYGKTWSVYKDGMGVTNNPPTGKYYPSKVISISNGILHEDMHNEGGINMTAALSPMLNGAYLSQLHGKYAVRFRYTAAPGYKYVWLLWPKSNQWNDGEINFAEGNRQTGSSGFMHFEGSPRKQDEFKIPDIDMGQWHTFSCEWTAGKVVYIMDDKVFGTSERAEVPAKPMRLTLQTESCVGAPCPVPDAKASADIDWVVIYAQK